MHRLTPGPQLGGFGGYPLLLRRPPPHPSCKPPPAFPASTDVQVPGGNMSKLVASRWKLRSRPVTPLQYVQVLQGQQ